MKLRNLGYLIKEGFRGLWTNRLMTLASVAVLTTCLILVGFASLISLNIDEMVRFIEQQSTMIVFIKDDASTKNIEALEQQIKAYDGVKEVVFISKEAALEDYKKAYGENAHLLDGLEDDNPLPASFSVTLEDLTDLNKFIDWVDAKEVVDYSKASVNTADTLVNFRQIVNAVLGAIIIALIIVSLVIISNSIRASIYARRTEVGIMRYVGATNMFIRIPFLIEGVLLGLFSAAIAYLLIWAGYQKLVEYLLDQNNSNFLFDLFRNVLPFDVVSKKLALYLLAAGPATGVLGCMTSLRKHLKV